MAAVSWSFSARRIKLASSLLRSSHLTYFPPAWRSLEKVHLNRSKKLTVLSVSLNFIRLPAELIYEGTLHADDNLLGCSLFNVYFPWCEPMETRQVEKFAQIQTSAPTSRNSFQYLSDHEYDDLRQKNWCTIFSPAILSHSEEEWSNYRWCTLRYSNAGDHFSSKCDNTVKKNRTAVQLGSFSFNSFICIVLRSRFMRHNYSLVCF